MKAPEFDLPGVDGKHYSPVTARGDKGLLVMFICNHCPYVKRVIDGSESVAQSGARFFELILKTASGERSKSESFGYGDDEFAPWTIGATM